MCIHKVYPEENVLFSLGERSATKDVFQLLSASPCQGQAPCYCHPAIIVEVQPLLSEIQSSEPLCTTQSEPERCERRGEGLERGRDLAFREERGSEETTTTSAPRL